MRKLLAPVAVLGLVLAMAGTVLAWVQPTLTSDCAPDANHFAWKMNLHNEQNFSAAMTTNFGSAGDHSFLTPRGGATLHVRWTSDHNSKAQAAANIGPLRQGERERVTERGPERGGVGRGRDRNPEHVG